MSIDGVLSAGREVKWTFPVEIAGGDCLVNSKNIKEVESVDYYGGEVKCFAGELSGYFPCSDMSPFNDA